MTFFFSQGNASITHPYITVGLGVRLLLLIMDSTCILCWTVASVVHILQNIRSTYTRCNIHLNARGVSFSAESERVMEVWKMVQNVGRASLLEPCRRWRCSDKISDSSKRPSFTQINFPEGLAKTCSVQQVRIVWPVGRARQKIIDACARWNIHLNARGAHLCQWTEALLQWRPSYTTASCVCRWLCWSSAAASKLPRVPKYAGLLKILSVFLVISHIWEMRQTNSYPDNVEFVV